MYILFNIFKEKSNYYYLVLISLVDLNKIIKWKLKDCNVLLNNNRYKSVIYLGGLATEIALKRAICNSFQLNLGYPELPNELNSYTTLSSIGVIKIHQLKIHNLQDLLAISGYSSNIAQRCPQEWFLVNTIWNIDIRYKAKTYRKLTTQKFLKAVKVIINNL